MCQIGNTVYKSHCLTIVHIQNLQAENTKYLQFYYVLQKRVVNSKFQVQNTSDLAQFLEYVDKVLHVGEGYF